MQSLARLSTGRSVVTFSACNLFIKDGNVSHVQIREKCSDMCVKERTCTHSQSHTLSLIVPSDLVLPGSAAGGLRAQGRRLGLAEWEADPAQRLRGSLHIYTLQLVEVEKEREGAPGQHFSIRCILLWAVISMLLLCDEDDSLPQSQTDLNSFPCRIPLQSRVWQ